MERSNQNSQKYGTFRKKKTKKTQRSKEIPEAESQATVQFEIVPSDGLNSQQLLFVCTTQSIGMPRKHTKKCMDVTTLQR